MAVTGAAALSGSAGVRFGALAGPTAEKSRSWLTNTRTGAPGGTVTVGEISWF
ncbi:MAG: hypothetical protein ABI740_09045 [Alphaproteobacteria bacterium]